MKKVPKADYKDTEYYKKRQVAKNILAKWHIIDDVIDHYIAQLKSSECSLTDLEELPHIPKEYTKAIQHSLTERQKYIADLIVNTVRYRTAIEKCADSLSATEYDVFFGRYIARKAWKNILDDYSERGKLNINRDLLDKMTEAIIQADR